MPKANLKQKPGNVYHTPKETQMTQRRRIIKRFPPKSHIELRVPSTKNEPQMLRDCIECGAVSKMIVTAVFACTSCEMLFN